MTTPHRFDLTLAVVTHVAHWAREDGLWAYEPYVREMSVWADLFRTVEVCAPVGEGPISGNQAPYSARNVNWKPVHYSSSNGAAGRMHRLRQLPTLARVLRSLIKRSDLVLLRSPGHPALVGRAIADALRTPHITKWAGFFGPFPGERLPRRLERYLAARSRKPVLVYGPAEAPHLVTFLPALMTEDELERARNLSLRRTWDEPWRVLSVGRLSAEKGFDLAIQGLARLRQCCPELPWVYKLIGDGLEAPALRNLAKRSGIDDRVTFTGALSFRAVQEHYATAHVVVMPGACEGWPKPIAEAWAHGAVPLAAVGGIIPWIMKGKPSGLTFAPTPDGLAEALRALICDPALMQRMSDQGPLLVRELSLESFRARLERVLVDSCRLS